MFKKESKQFQSIFSISIYIELFARFCYIIVCEFVICKPKSIEYLSVPFSIADNLPVATRLEFYPNREAGAEEEQQKKDVVKDIQFEHGYRLGFVDSNKVDILPCPLVL